MFDLYLVLESKASIPRLATCGRKLSSELNPASFFFSQLVSFPHAPKDKTNISKNFDEIPTPGNWPIYLRIEVDSATVRGPWVITWKMRTREKKPGESFPREKKFYMGDKVLHGRKVLLKR